MKKWLILGLNGWLSYGLAHADTTDQYIKSYLELVYPTSNEIKTMSDTQLRDLYANQMNVWFRIPMPGFESGLFDARVVPQYRVFVFPDTAARARTDLNNDQLQAKEGFNSDKVILGSNKDYIEISSLAWMSFPYGAYLNWAHGSGIYLYTGGKTISGYTKVDVLYKIYAKHNKLAEYYTKLGATEMVHRQIFGSDLPLDQLLTIYANAKTTADYAQKVDYLKFTADKLHIPNGAEPLAVALFNTTELDHTKLAQLVKAKKYQQAYLMLVTVYVNDHKEGKFDQQLARYKYLGGEAAPDIDEWMYDAAKAEGYNVVQMTYEPNSMGQPTFELCDLRWPKITGVPNIAYDAIDKGLQHYSLKFAWDKSSQWLSQRDPYDLMNDSKARPIKIVMPDLNDLVDPQAILPTPKTFPHDWLPSTGWNLKSAVGNYHKTDTFVAWIVPQAAPHGLSLPNNQGRFISWGLSTESGLSFTDVGYNVKLLEQALPKK